VLAPLTSIREDIASQRELEVDLAALEAELAALEVELEARDLRGRFAAPLAELQARLEELRSQHARASLLLERLVPEPAAGGPAPSPAAAAPTVPPGEPR
jgi:septal ring factor EnvC (AmiA/AmiB activator)